MISGGIEAYQFAQICSILEMKSGDGLLPTNLTGWTLPSTIIQPFSGKSISGITAMSDNTVI